MRIGFGRRQLAGSREDDSEALAALGCERIFTYETPLELKDQFDELLDFCRPNDSIVLIHLDRLGSSLSQILDAIEQLDDKSLRLVVRECDIEPGTPFGDNFALVCKLLKKLEPAKPTSERARRRGRPSVLDESTQEKALRLLSGNTSVTEVARLLRVSPATIYRCFPRRARAGGKV
jgi:DNA invertase Pin-like site-specific DNA recombinase